MISVNIEIRDIDKLRTSIARAPGRSVKYLANATKAAIFEVEKQSIDRNFQFKWPRSKRTGQLQRSFAFGRYIDPSGLVASIGPTVYYAPFVYFGTRNMVPNYFMDRIARAAEPHIQKHFDTAVEKIINDI